MVKLDRSNNNVFTLYDYYPTWLVYTDITGTGMNQGLVKSAFEIDLEWVSDKMPRLKEIDVSMLCGGGGE